MSYTLVHNASENRKGRGFGGKCVGWSSGFCVTGAWFPLHAPQQQVVGAVVPPHRLAAIGQSEVFIAVAAADDQQVGFGGQEGGGTPSGGVSSLQASAAALGAVLC